jgi:hypothetical protein
MSDTWKTGPLPAPAANQILLLDHTQSGQMVTFTPSTAMYCGVVKNCWQVLVKFDPYGKSPALPANIWCLYLPGEEVEYKWTILDYNHIALAQ